MAQSLRRHSRSGHLPSTAGISQRGVQLYCIYYVHHIKSFKEAVPHATGALFPSFLAPGGRRPPRFGRGGRARPCRRKPVAHRHGDVYESRGSSSTVERPEFPPVTVSEYVINGGQSMPSEAYVRVVSTVPHVLEVSIASPADVDLADSQLKPGVDPRDVFLHQHRGRTGNFSDPLPGSAVVQSAAKPSPSATAAPSTWWSCACGSATEARPCSNGPAPASTARPSPLKPGRR